MKKRLLSAFLAAMLLAPVCHADDPYLYIPVYKTEDKEEALDIPETIEAEVHAFESNVVRTTEDRSLLGYCLEWGDRNSGFMKSNDSLEFNDDYLALTPEIKAAHSTRTAGGSLNVFDWKKAVGPMSQRKIAGEMWCYSRPSNFGPAEWVKQFQHLDPDCTFIVGLNVLTDTPEDLADYAEFFLGDSSTTYGALRAEMGIQDPVKVGAFELGNEVDYYIDIKSYSKKCIDTILAIRERFPDSKFMMCGVSYPLEKPIDDMGWRNWTIEGVKALGEYIDYMSFHAYYDGQTMAWTERFLNQIQEDIKSIVGDKPIQFAYTEAAVWPADNGYGDPPVESQTQMLTGVLSTADFLSRMFKRADSWASSYFCWSAEPNLTGDWGVLGPGDNEQKWYASGIIKMYNLFDEMLGEKVLYSYVKSDNKYALHEHENSKYSVLVTQNGDDELMLILTNKTEAKKFHTTFNFENKYKLVEETIFTAPSMSSKVYGKSTDDVFTTTTTPMNVNNFSEYTAQEKSLIFLRLKKMGGTAADVVTFDGETQFQDLDTFWGRNEINNLAKDGILSGMESGVFAPDAPLTRAQMAQMLSSALAPEEETAEGEETENPAKIELPEKSFQMPFTDCQKNAWYQNAVYDAYSSGYMRGESDGKFYPERNITKEELAAIAVRAARALQPEVSGTADDAWISGFAHQDEISDWAREPIAYAVKSGLFRQFYENGNFEPKAPATRGEAAVLLYRIRAMR